MRNDKNLINVVRKTQWGLNWHIPIDEFAFNLFGNQNGNVKSASDNGHNGLASLSDSEKYTKHGESYRHHGTGNENSESEEVDHGGQYWSLS